MNNTLRFLILYQRWVRATASDLQKVAISTDQNKDEKSAVFLSLHLWFNNKIPSRRKNCNRYE